MSGLSKQAFLNPSFHCGIWSVINIPVALATIAWFAQWLNILDNICPTQRERNNMVNRQGQICATATKTLVAVVGAKLLPLISRVRSTIAKLSGAATIVPGIHLARVFLSISPIPFRRFLRIIRFPHLLNSPYAPSVFVIPISPVFKEHISHSDFPLSPNFSRPFRVIFPPTCRPFSAFLEIVFAIFTTFCPSLFSAIFPKSCRDLLSFVGVGFLPLFAFHRLTFYASTPLVPPTRAAFFTRQSISCCHWLLQIKTPRQDAQKCDLVSLAGVLINKYSVLNFSSNISLGRMSIIPKYTSAINIIEGAY